MNFFRLLFKQCITFLLVAAFTLLSQLVSACDTSGYQMNGITDNGDGTFTIQWTAMVAGGGSTGVGSTWGFYLSIVNAQILSINPPSFTSANGTTLNAIVTGNSVAWGNPVPSGNPPFLNITLEQADQWFTFTMVVQGIPVEWNGGGQEANFCPGGAGTNLVNYHGEFPCFEPVATPAVTEIHICPGETAVLNVTPNYLTETVTWSPGGMTGNTISVSPPQTTTYTITAANAVCESTSTITVIVDPLPVVTPFDPELEACPGTPVLFEVLPQNVGNITWNPGNVSSPSTFFVTVPPALPAVYTATGSNNCGTATATFIVTALPYPAINIVNANETICVGESVTLTATATNASSVSWQPGGTNGTSITVSPAVTTSYVAIAFNNCGFDFDTVIVNVAGALATSLTLEACEGESVMYNGVALAAGSTSSFTYTSYAGCDSVVTVTVEELQPASSALQLEACENSTAPYNGQNLNPGSVTEFTFTAANGCDSVVTVTVVELPTYTETLALEACTGTTVSYNGDPLQPGSTTEYTFQSLAGCDSVVTVTVTELPTYSNTLTLQTCTGSTITYAGQQLAPGTVTEFTFASIDGCDSVMTVTVEELSVFTSQLGFNACPGSTVNYNGQALSPGSVTDFNFITANGCDSIVTVTVTEVAAILNNVDFDACTGTAFSYNGNDLQPGSVTDFTFITPQGCDSIVTVTINELQTFSSALTLKACTGDLASYNGQALAPGSVTDFTLTASNGCDSVVTVTVNEIGIVTGSLQLQACTGTTAPYNGQQLAPGSVTDFTFTSWQGCDSIMTVSVMELQTWSSALALQACTGSTVAYNGMNLSPGTVIDFTFNAVNGCDSVVTVTVTGVNNFMENIALEACPGTTVSYNGQNLQPGSVTDFTFTSSLGCDSIVTVTVNELDVFNTPLALEACTGSTVVYNGQTLQPGSVTDFTFTAANGCDSIVTVTVIEVPVLTSSLQLSACQGSTAIYNGQTLQPGSVTDFTFTSSQGCDSIVTVTVIGLSNETFSVQLDACEGSTATYNGQTLQPGSMTNFTFTTWQGCDSIVTVTVNEIPIQTSTLELQACHGSSITYNGQTLLPGSVTDVVLTGPNGCDSIVTVTVQSLAIATGTLTLQGCEGESLIFNGTEIQPGASMDFTLTAANGCDSILTVTALPPVPVVNTSEFMDVCEGTSVVLFGQEVSTPGIYSQTYTGSNGCDSTHTVSLSFSNNIVLFFPDDITVKLGDSVVLYPALHPLTGLTFSWLDDPALSCLDCRNPTATPINTTTYTLTVSDAEGCKATASQLVNVDKSRGVFIPNVFSPNSDGINDLFMIFSDGRSVKQVHTFMVFSRWGESVYEFHNFLPDNPDFSWDGSYRGKKMDTGVFVYFAEVEFIDGERQLFKGDVTLLR